MSRSPAGSDSPAPDRRSAGVLCHPTSLPGPFGIGGLGPDAFGFLEWAADAGFAVWQVLPLNPADTNGSPYSGPSAFAGNPALISMRGLVDEGWLAADALARSPAWTGDRVEFGRVERFKQALLRRSFEAFRRDASRTLRHELESFVEDPAQAEWLHDWTLFAALGERFAGRRWSEWDAELRDRDAAAIRAASREFAEAIDYQRYLQFVFDRQWRRLRRAAARRGILLLGDLPFYVAFDSADVWAHPELFRLDAERRPLKISGVPPDYFSDTGQLWGQPTYDWERMSVDGYAWWVRRIRSQLRWADRIRLDHFRGFVAYWEVDAGESTAEGGSWIPGPGRDLFDAIAGSLGSLPFVAEDLGSITEAVHELRDGLGLPGMRVLQFGFDDGHAEHLPERFAPQSVAYTGTHDNDTARGWLDSLDDDRRRRVRERLGDPSVDLGWRMIEAVYDSAARLSVIPLQDLFGLGSEARMNTPAVAEGNWSWRATRERLDADLAYRLRDLARRCGRLE